MIIEHAHEACIVILGLNADTVHRKLQLVTYELELRQADTFDEEQQCRHAITQLKLAIESNEKASAHLLDQLRANDFNKERSTTI